MFSSDEPPLSTEKAKIKNKQGNVLQGMLISLVKLVKIKNHFNKLNQFLAFWPQLFSKRALVKTTDKVVFRIKSAKNFIVEKRIAPHIAIGALGFSVILCNVLVASGADNLFSLIPADPSSQISVTNSISKYTPLISNSSTAVEQLVSSSESSSDVFVAMAKTVSTEVTVQEVEAQPVVSAGPRTKNITYVVESGDTLSGLSMKFNVKTSSIQFANSLSNADMIKPGDKLKIPPDGWEPSASQIAAAKKTTSSSNKSKTTSVNYSVGSKSNGYPYGWCTYYVAVRRSVPVSWGNAGQWLNSAKRAGYATGSAPAVGSIMVTRESWWGHVAFVESVSGNSFTVAEMNYAGWGVVSRRTMSSGDGVIKGFIY